MAQQKNGVFPSEGSRISLTSVQQDIYFDQLRNPELPLYNIGGLIKLDKIDYERLLLAHKHVLIRNDAFHIRLTIENEAVFQRLDADVNATLPLIDVRDGDPELWMQSKFAEAFDLEAGPLYRAWLLQVTDNNYYYVGLAHHIILDGWGFSNWARQLVNAYTTEECPASEFSWQHHVEKNKAYLNSVQCDRDRDYWLGVMSKAPDKFLSRRSSQSFREEVPHRRSMRETLEIDPELYVRLLECARESGVSVSQVYMAVVAIYFCKAYSIDEIVLGSPVHNRSNFQEKHAIGSFVSMMPVRLSYQPNVTLREYLQQLKRSQRKGFKHQRFPAGLLQKALGSQGLYEIVYNYLMLEKPNLSTGQVPLEYVANHYELTPFKIIVWDRGDSYPIQLHVDFNVDYFSSEQAVGILERIIHLLKQFPKAAETPMEQLSIISPEERSQLLGYSQGRCLPYPKEQCVHEMFEQQVKARPTAEAIAFAGQSINYESLNRQANQLAWYLKENHSVCPEELVGICVERSPIMVVYIMAVLKAGGAYVPIDPKYPLDRRNYMLRDSAVKVVLTQIDMVAGLKDAGVTPLVADSLPIETYPITNLPKSQIGLSSQNLAYVIYTSGSTGQPKGVMVEHRQLANFIQNINEHYQMQQSDRVLQFSSISFDVFVKEFLTSFCYGATMVIRDDECVTSPDLFFQFCSQNRISVMSLPTAFWHQLCTFVDRMYPQLNLVSAGGEEMNAKALQKWFDSGINATLIHGYGPTEVTVNAISCPITADVIGKSKIPIGRPNNNVTTYLLTSERQLAPLGVVGEIYIAGAGVARGYLNRDELSAERFVFNPLHIPGNTNSSEVMYKTGDLARIDNDGQFEFVGRIDNQVKIRGFRVELGEIEHHIEQLDSVDACLVKVKKSDNGSQSLIAYLKLHKDVALDSPGVSIRKALLETLPEHMVPTMYATVREWPLSANGKIDLKALLNLPLEMPEQDHVAPSNEIQQQLVAVWSEVLQLPAERVGLESHFFQLGGDSISSIQLVARAAKFNLHFSVKDLFEAPTIAQLSLRVKDTAQSLAEQGNVQGVMPLLPIHKDFFADCQGSSHFNQSVLLQVPVDLSIDILRKLFCVLLQRHDALRMRFSQIEGQWSGVFPEIIDKNVYSDLTEQAVGVKDWSTLSVFEYHRQLDQVQASLDIGTGKLFKAVLHTSPVDQENKRLLIAIHHLVIDGVSWRVLLSDLADLYRQIMHNQTLGLAAKTASYKQWIEHLVTLANQGEFDGQRERWLAQFSRKVSLLVNNAVNREALAKCQKTKDSIARATFRLSPENTHQLQTVAGSSYRTQINELLLAALLSGVNAVTSVRDLRIDLEGHGRDQIDNVLDISQTLGWFTSIYPLQMHMPESTAIGDLINTVKTAYRLLPDSSIAFGMRQHYCNDTELLSMPPRELIFNYLGHFDNVLDTDKSPFLLLDDYRGAEVSPERSRPHLLALNGLISGGQLTFELSFPPEKIAPEFAEQLMAAMHTGLIKIIEHCVEMTDGDYVAVDFPMANVSDSLLAQWLQRYQGVEDLYPATGLQQGMLYENMIKEGRYVTQFVMEVSELNEEAFHHSWQQLINRHAILRTAFVGMNEGNTHQLVQTDVEIPWYNKDIQNIEKERQFEYIEQLLRQDKQQGFDVECSPLIRVTLIKRDASRTLVVLTHHHVLLDGWSLPLALKELLTFYQRATDGLPDPTPAPVVQFKDYMGWLAKQNHVESNAFWRERVTDINKRTPVPFLDELDIDQKSAGSDLNKVTLQLNTADTQVVLNAAKQSGITANVIMQAAWGLLLHRYSASDQIVFGTTTSGRPPQMFGVERILGLFINTLPVQMQIDESLSVAHWCSQLHAEFIASEQFNYTPLYSIQSQSALKESLFDSLFVLENFPNDIPIEQLCEQHGLKVAHVADIKESHYGLTLIASLSDTLGLQIEAPENRMKLARLEQLARHYLHTLKQIATLLANSPGETLASVNIMPDEDKQALIANWACGEKRQDYVQPVHRLFEAQAVLHPDNTALEMNNDQLDYRSLNMRSNRLARVLISAGVKPGEIVGLLLPRSTDLITGLLAVLKCGAAYLPLDPEYPEERLRFMIEDSNAGVILTNTATEAVLSFFDGTVVTADSDYWCQRLSEQEDVNLPIDYATGENLAYINYTSGSTGQPKGVMAPHRGIIRLVKQPRFMSLDTSTRFLQVSTVSFDAATLEIWGPLLNGGVCVLYPESHLDIDVLENCIERHKVNAIFVTTGLFNQWAQTMPELPSLRFLITGGERANAQAFVKADKKLKNAVIVNAYGPTENTTFTTCYRYGEIDYGEAIIPIGSPLNDTSLHVLDQELQPVPFGAIGELFTGGTGVSLGYLNSPEQQSKSFIDNPWGEGKLYRTGDLVRYRADGELVFVGRVDNQVKIRGFRIEPDEIIASLNRLPQILMSVVVVREREPGDKHLIAYIVPADCENFQEQQEKLKSYLGGDLTELLPAYMVPSCIMIVDSLPLKSTGKVDHAALPEPVWQIQQQLIDQLVNDVEEQLAVLWSQLLQVPVKSIGRSSDFFRLGGHSLLAVKLSHEVRNSYAVPVSIAAFLQNPTIAHLGQLIEQYETTNTTCNDTELVATASSMPIGKQWPLSFAQSRLWFIDKIQNGSVEYNMPVAFDVTGELDVQCLEKAFLLLIEQHTILRTGYIEKDGMVFQFIRSMDKLAFTVEQHDLSGLNDVERRVARDDITTSHAQTPFNLQTDLVIRISYLKLSSTTGRLLFNMHHIASDGWSMDLLLVQLQQYYDDLYADLEVSFKPLDIQYVDYAQWQRQYLDGPAVENDLSYWMQQLDNVPILHSLPIAGERPDRQQQQGAVLGSSLSKDIAQPIIALARATGLTPFMLLHAALSLVLSRHSNSSDVVIGTPVANRLEAQLQPLIGFFVNTLVLRLNTRVDKLAEFLQHVRQVHIAAQSHQELPFELLVEKLNVPRSTAFTPLFQIMLTNGNDFSVNKLADQGGVKLSRATLCPLPSHITTAKFDLELNAKIGPQGIDLNWIYDIALFSETEIIRFNRHLVELLSNLADLIPDPDLLAAIRCADLEMLDREETIELVEELSCNTAPSTNTESPDYTEKTSDENCLHRFFEQQCALHGNKIAIVFGEQEITFSRLNASANQLAHYIQKTGLVTSDTAVALCLDRSIETVVAILAVLKAGGAYLPMDPAYPPARITNILNDAKPPVFLTTDKIQSSLTDVLADYPGHTVSLDGLEEGKFNSTHPCSNQSCENPAMPGSSSKNLAYIIYTSGSTGLPKGVMVEHDSVVALMHEMRTWFTHDIQCMAWCANYVFDASLQGLCFLMGGTKLVVLNDLQKLDPRALSDCLLRNNVDLLDCTPSLLQFWLSHESDICLPDLLIGGEPVSPQLWQTLVNIQRDQGKRHINVYGPTECAVNSTLTTINGELPHIGRPVSYARTYIMVPDSSELVPKGAVGELCIGGSGVARGYLNRQSLTDEKFIHDPFTCEPNARLYRTGDLVRYLDDGSITFVGRDDDQVKIRGHRIELGEVSRQLSGLQHVHSSLVQTRELAGSLQIVAWIKPAEDFTSLDESTFKTQVKNELNEVLPEYMVPSVLLVIDEWPLSTSGKIDKRSLPEPTATLAMTLPQSDTEKTLARVWTGLLGLSEGSIGRESNFFNLGGHSLLSVRLQSQIRTTFGIDVEIASLFARPVLADMSSLVDVMAADFNDTDDHSLAVLEPISHEEPVALSFAQQRLWLIDSLQSGSVEYNMPLALHVEGSFDVDCAERALQTIVQRHQVLRTTYQEQTEAPGLVQCVNSNVNIKIERLDLSMFAYGLKQQRLRTIIANEVEHRFNLKSDLMLRSKWVQLDYDKGVLVLNMHHIASDGWSLGILARELVHFYLIQSEHKPKQLLPELPIQYRDFALWQRQQLNSTVLAKQIEYWKEQLGGLPCVHSLPLDYSRPNQKGNQGGIVRGELDETLGMALITLANTSDITLFMLLHGVFSLLLAQQSGNNDIVIGIPVANRKNTSVENLIGFFVNTLVLRTVIDPQARFTDYLSMVRQVNIAAQEHQDAPFEHLVECLRVPRELAYTPLFQVMLSMDTTEEVTIQLPGVSVSHYQQEVVMAKFDLQLDVVLREGQLYLQWIYDKSLFKEKTINAMHQQFISLAETLMKSTELPLSNVVGDICTVSPTLQAQSSGYTHLNATEKQKVRATTEVQRRLKTMWLELLNLHEQELSITDNFFAIGGHSLLAASLRLKIATAFGVEIPLRSLFDMPTIEQMADWLDIAISDNQSASSNSKSLVLLKPGDENVRSLVLIHPVGGELYAYQPLVQAMPASVPVYGFVAGDDISGSVTEIAGAYLQCIHDSLSPGHYLLAGWSAGGVIAYEMARLLEKHGGFTSVVMIDSDYPSGQVQDLQRWQLMMTLAAELGLRVNSLEQKQTQNLASMSAEKLLELLYMLLKRDKCLPANFSQEMLNAHFNRALAIYEQCTLFQPGVVKGKVSYIAAQDSAVSGAHNLWQKHISNLDSHVLPADHFSIVKSPVVDSVVEILIALGLTPFTQLLEQLEPCHD